jgi:hypothetical protein
MGLNLAKALEGIDLDQVMSLAHDALCGAMGQN